MNAGAITLINGAAAVVLNEAVEAAQRVKVETAGQNRRQPRLLVSARASESSSAFDFFQSEGFSHEAKRISEKYGGSKAAIEQKLRDDIDIHGITNLVDSAIASPERDGALRLRSTSLERKARKSLR